jgi:1,4-dihydroxy-6-naphthoate synthase
MSSLTLAYSPCPNDTFIFTPWVEGRIPEAPPVVERYEDIDTLNQIALRGEPDIVKVSFHALGHLRDKYYLLRSGGALGRGCGPLIIAKTPFEGKALAEKTVAIPGRLTTAALLMRLFAPELRDANITVMQFDQIMPAVCEGRVDAGVISHESRFTYQRHGLTQIVDLGEWWERETGHAIPLGGFMRRDLGADLVRKTERASPTASTSRLRTPISSADCPQARAGNGRRGDAPAHRAYVNDFTRNYGSEGAAIAYPRCRRPSSSASSRARRNRSTSDL